MKSGGYMTIGTVARIDKQLGQIVISDVSRKHQTISYHSGRAFGLSDGIPMPQEARQQPEGCRLKFPDVGDSVVVFDDSTWGYLEHFTFLNRLRYGSNFRFNC
jgi:hypothetical protein